MILFRIEREGDRIAATEVTDDTIVVAWDEDEAAAWWTWSRPHRAEGRHRAGSASRRPTGRGRVE